MADITPEQVWEAADGLMAGDGGTAEIDSVFSFLLNERDFVERIAAMRQALFNGPDAPYERDAEGKKQRGQWVQNFDWHLKAIPPAAYETRHKQYYGELTLLAKEYTLPQWAVDHYLFFGVPPTISPLRAVLRESGNGAVSVEIRVLSSDVTGEQIARFYDTLRALNELPALAYDRPAGGHGPETVRAWAIQCLTAHGGLDEGAAAKAWDERYPTHKGAGDGALGDVRYRAEGVRW